MRDQNNEISFDFFRITKESRLRGEGPSRRAPLEKSYCSCSSDIFDLARFLRLAIASFGSSSAIRFGISSMTWSTWSPPSMASVNVLAVSLIRSLLTSRSV